VSLSLYEVGLAVAGLVVLGVAVLPRLVSDRPISLPVFYLAFGAGVFALPVGFPNPDPLAYRELTERLTELGVVVALTGAGLKLDRRPGWPGWESTVRLLAVTMPLTVLAAVALGWGVAGFALPTAVLLGAVVAPTDPVLASEVQVEQPGAGAEDETVSEHDGMADEVRFALTSEAGLNDSLAFPVTYLAILLALVGTAPTSWAGEWLLVFVGYKLAVGLIAGVVLGKLLARLVFALRARTSLARSLMGIEALAGTLLVYGATELLNGYGFLAVFVAAVVVRDHERSHDYHGALHEVAEMAEYLLMAGVMILFGGALVNGLLAELTVETALVGLALVFLVRPLAGLVGQIGFGRSVSERATIATFGIRGLGSFYYLAYALNHAPFAGAEALWGLVGFVVLVSTVVHGITATPVVDRLDLG
jgi:NhaP-type Na+/H+ or K+/H+ antiporter